jgi:adenylate cyclase
LPYHFEDYVLDPDRRELRRESRLLAIEPKVFDLLVHLVSNSDRVISKDDLIATIWHGRVVSESALTTCINAARTAIGDSGEAQRLIKTLPRKGIRFVGKVEQRPTGASTSGGLPDMSTLTLPDKPSIAVLPFTNMSGDPEQVYFADGIVEDIITALSRFKALFVIARNSSFAYKGKSPDIRQVGRDLGVRYVLEGSVRKAGRRLRIAAQLIDAVSGAHTWVERFDGALDDVFELQDEVTERVVAAIAPRLERAEILRARRRSPINTDAYDCYLRGLACLTPISRDGMEQALGLFIKANDLDPDYAPAYGMAIFCHANRFGFGLTEDAAYRRSEISRLWQMIARVGHDDGLALGQAAWAVAFVLRDLESARQLIDRAQELNPNLSSVWISSGWISVWEGNPDLAMKHLKRAERLDPGAISITIPSLSPMAHACFFLGQHEEALTLAERLVGHNPSAHPALRIGAASAVFAGRSDTAHRLATRLQALDPAFRVSRLREYLGPYREPGFVEKYAEGLRRAGLPD